MYEKWYRHAIGRDGWRLELAQLGRRLGVRWARLGDSETR